MDDQRLIARDPSFSQANPSYRSEEKMLTRGDPSFRSGEKTLRRGDPSFRSGEKNLRRGDPSFRSGEKKLTVEAIRGAERERRSSDSPIRESHNARDEPRNARS